MAESKVTLPLTGTGDATAPMMVDSVTKGAVTANVQYVKVMDGVTGGGNELSINSGGEVKVNAADGSIVTLGTAADTSATATIFGKLMKLISLLPTALGAGGGLKIDGSGTALPVSQSGSNWSVNQAQVAGAATDTNSGNKSAGTQRVVIATDQPALTNALLVQAQPKYGSGTALTITLTSLGATSGRESTAVDNSTNLYEDALVFAQLKSSAVSANDTVAYVYVAGSINDGSDNWPDAVTGADAAITVNSPTQLKLLGVVNFGATGAAAGTFKGGPWSVGALFGGTLPKKWSIVVVNSNAALTATAADHKVIYVGVNR